MERLVVYAYFYKDDNIIKQLACKNLWLNF